jgi:hypothetical protein
MNLKNILRNLSNKTYQRRIFFVGTNVGYFREGNNRHEAVISNNSSKLKAFYMCVSYEM